MIEDFGKQELQAFVLGVLAPQTRQVSEDLPSVRHNAITLGPMAAHIALPWFGAQYPGDTVRPEAELVLQLRRRDAVECVAIKNAAQNQVVSGSLLACMIAPAVTEVCRPHLAYS